MAAFHSLRLLPATLSVSQSPISRGRNLLAFGPMLAQEAAFRVHRGGASSCLHIPRGVSGSVSGSAMQEEEMGEGEVSRTGNSSVEQVATDLGWIPLVVVSFYKFANLPDYEQKRAPLKQLCETHVRIFGVKP